MSDNIWLVIVFALLGLNALSLIFIVSYKAKINKLAARINNLDEAANESYVKFLSDSRDWAYEYIQEVQEKLETFSKKVEPQLNYYNTYGTSVQGPHQILAKEISEAYEDLKTIMPEDNKEI
jgi:predicted PurR-regulated permease PerM